MAWWGGPKVQKTLTQTVQGTLARFNKAMLRCLPVGPIFIYPNSFSLFLKFCFGLHSMQAEFYEGFQNSDLGEE